ncbi:MAG: head GIN domain-containing protein [Sphingomonadaceae bacterium]
MIPHAAFHSANAAFCAALRAVCRSALSARRRRRYHALHVQPFTAFKETTMTFTASLRPLGALLLATTLACLVPAHAAPLSWGHGEHVQGNGTLSRQNRELGHFTALSTSLGGHVEIRLGKTESISIETDDNLLPLIETVIENGTLRIRQVRKDLQLEPRSLKIVVQAKDMERIAVAGSGTVVAERLQAPKLGFDIGGSGAIQVRNLEAQAVAISLGGSGELKASGKAEQVQVSIGGSGKVQAGQLQARDVMVSIGGSGQATVAARTSLNVSVAGSGDVAYYGDPQITKSILGSGALKRLGAAQ